MRLGCNERILFLPPPRFARLQHWPRHHSTPAFAAATTAAFRMHMSLFMALTVTLLAAVMVGMQLLRDFRPVPWCLVRSSIIGAHKLLLLLNPTTAIGQTLLVQRIQPGQRLF